MALSNATIFLAASLAFIYIVIYKKNRFIGNILFLAIGAIGFQDTTTAGYAIIIFAGAFISFIYDIMEPKGRGTQGRWLT